MLRLGGGRFEAAPKIVIFPPVRNGAPDTIRTCGLYLRRVALYPAELRVHARPSLARSVSGWSPDSSPHGVGLPPRNPRPDARGGAEPTLERLFFGIVHEIRSVSEPTPLRILNLRRSTSLPSAILFRIAARSSAMDTLCLF